MRFFRLVMGGRNFPFKLLHEIRPLRQLLKSGQVLFCGFSISNTSVCIEWMLSLLANKINCCLMDQCNGMFMTSSVSTLILGPTKDNALLRKPRWLGLNLRQNGRLVTGWDPKNPCPIRCNNWPGIWVILSLTDNCHLLDRRRRTDMDYLNYLEGQNQPFRFTDIFIIDAFRSRDLKIYVYIFGRGGKGSYLRVQAEVCKRGRVKQLMYY